MVLGVALAAPAIGAETLYVASLRDYTNAETEGLGGGLYTTDTATGKSALLARLKVGGVIPIGLTGLAIHPKTGVFYGITAGLASQIPRSLVTVDPKTGNTTLVGSLNHSGSDIRFDTKGTLYVWLNEEARVATVDLGTGAATPLGPSGYEETLGGGIAIDRSGEMYVSATNAAGTLDNVDLTTGHATVGARLSGAPYIAALDSMAFSPSGTLYAVNSNLGAPAKGMLVTIDVKSGTVKEIGALPNDVDALAFGPSAPDPTATSKPIEPWITIVLALAAGMALGYGFASVFKRKT
ncbi:MAG TPA: hypothetical protein VII36_00640 [Usitatibacter sp.]